VTDEQLDDVHTLTRYSGVTGGKMERRIPIIINSFDVCATGHQQLRTIVEIELQRNDEVFDEEYRVPRSGSIS
jgi:hypothetical protein